MQLGNNWRKQKNSKIYQIQNLISFAGRIRCGMDAAGRDRDREKNGGCHFPHRGITRQGHC
jgi:hypothetical protein